MIFKNLGRSEKKISAIGFGCGIGGVNASTADYSKLGESLREGLKMGVNFIDTSPVYGNGQSEEIVGKTVCDLNISDNIVIATKVLPGETHYDGVLNSVNSSLERLSLKKIDLIQIHWPNPSVSHKETVSAIEKLKSENKIDLFGVSNYSFKEIKEIHEELNINKTIGLSSIQVEYNFSERSVEKDIIPFCIENNITPIGYTPLMRGRMAPNRDQRILLRDMSKKYQCSIPQLILKWISMNDRMVVLTNTTKMKRVRENFSAIDVYISEHDRDIISNKCIPPEEMVGADLIIDQNKEMGLGYTSVDEAIENHLGWTPSPLELSREILDGKMLKPIRLKKYTIKGATRYQILEGKLRFWSWVVAFGRDKKIPSIIWED
jgi:aryl-alcohol dehydrogenase-like predicted oxidoreductase